MKNCESGRRPSVCGRAFRPASFREAGDGTDRQGGRGRQGASERAADGHFSRRARRIVECRRSEEHTSELQSLMRISYAVFCLKKKKEQNKQHQQEATEQ